MKKSPNPSPEKIPEKNRSPNGKGRKSSRSRKTGELENIPSLIESLEQEHTLLFNRMSDPSFYKNESAEIAGAKERLDALEIELETAYQRWEALESVKENTR